MNANPVGDTVLNDTVFSAHVSSRFGRHAAGYARHARLQQGVAWRLAHLCAPLPIAAGPRADLGAGSGLVGQALRAQGCQEALLQLDICPELLAHNPLAAAGAQLGWDLNRGLPEQLGQASLLTSSFALQWLENPPAQVQHWCEQLRPGGWLGLAVPTSASFPQWHQAAAAAGGALHSPEPARRRSPANRRQPGRPDGSLQPPAALQPRLRQRPRLPAAATGPRGQHQPGQPPQYGPVAPAAALLAR